MNLFHIEWVVVDGSTSGSGTGNDRVEEEDDEGEGDRWFSSRSSFDVDAEDVPVCTALTLISPLGMSLDHNKTEEQTSPAAHDDDDGNIDDNDADDVSYDINASNDYVNDTTKGRSIPSHDNVEKEDTEVDDSNCDDAPRTLTINTNDDNNDGTDSNNDNGATRTLTIDTDENDGHSDQSNSKISIPTTAAITGHQEREPSIPMRASTTPIRTRCASPRLWCGW